MKKILAAGLGLALAALQPALACHVERLEDGSQVFLTLSSGWVYQILPGPGRMASQHWQPLDHVRVCPAGGGLYQLTDLAPAHPGSVTALRMSP